jgi:hypothetical protein
MRKILIVGATSAIAEATARLFAVRGEYLFLVGRDQERLQTIVDDLQVRGCPKLASYVMDANDFMAHEPMLDAAEKALGGVDTVLIAHGTLADQHACQQSVGLTMAEIKTNALSVIALLTHIANRFEQQKHGTIAVISSVAGDRGRQRNYVYGSAKAMVTAFLSGLRQRLYKSGVSVVTIKPGFVDTPMTKERQKGALWVGPDTVARKIVKSLGRPGAELYVPWFWRPLMAVIRLLPMKVFVRVEL